MKTETHFNQYLITNKFQFNFKGITNQFYTNNPLNNKENTKNKFYNSSKFDNQIIDRISKKTSLIFLKENETQTNLCFINSTELTNDFKTTFTLKDLFHYIYAVLHSSIYKEKHKDFFKLIYPPMPYPKNINTFLELVDLGNKLVKLHTSIPKNSTHSMIQDSQTEKKQVLKTQLKSKTLELIKKINEIEI
ncbi:type ISP restriction/modification enzyme [uncultured Lutibacter sp.]|uniref:type ISP restriction/modification enzyme n=1 Tax=uncultured Lutibacter sp. TaxID=437739 RepID=UPI00261C161C|nr:type ISP restriction/modification enzyme [uncultured Lutibacter sp.]